MTLGIAILAVTLAVGLVLAWPRLAHNANWQATVTPLASIIGSGFLVLGPTLNATYGGLAPLVMALLCASAYLIGSAVRFNIARLDRTKDAPGRFETRLDQLASWVLAFAYVVSVTYYLNLFGAFAVSLTPFEGPVAARLVTTAIFVFILGVGWFFGFKALEAFEQTSVTIKLAIIAGLLVGLAAFMWQASGAGGLAFYPPQETGWAGVTLAFGLIVTVQGFETSRYLGKVYDAPTRIRSMRWAQWISAAIYMVYILLTTYDFEIMEGQLTETAIVDMMSVVSPVLPVLLVIAALSAQFSAAVADTSGSGGLVEEQSNGRVSERMTYLLLGGVGIAMTWTSGVFEIIAYASRAFALYYAVQSAMAALGSQREGRMWPAIGFALVAMLAFAAFLFGTSVEG